MDRKKLIDSPEWNAGDVCVVCGSPYVQKHHIMYGTASRKKADRYHYILPLCREHHTGATGIHHDREMAVEWMKLAQEHFEKHYGSRDDFIKEFGRSYIL